MNCTIDWTLWNIRLSSIVSNHSEAVSNILTWSEKPISNSNTLKSQNNNNKNFPSLKVFDENINA